MNLRLVLLATAASIPVLSTAQAQNTPKTASTIAPIVVTATPLDRAASELPLPVTVLQGEKLVRKRQATLGETLSGEPGIQADSFGGGASRPVIRGQTSPRVKSLSDGSEVMDASAISPDHAVTAEPMLLEGIEVLRGPATLLYGGGAISGAVNLIDNKIPTEQPENGIEGVAELRGGTADKERTSVGGVTISAGPFAFRVEGVRRRSDDYRVPGFTSERVAGSFNDTSTYTLGGSWIGADGYLGAAYTRQRSEYGVPGHNHEFESCHLHGLHLHCDAHGDGHDEDDEDEHDHAGAAGASDTYVNLKSKRFDIRGEYRSPIAAIDRIRLRAGVTDYRHDEIDAGTIGTTFKNKGHDIRVEVEHAPIGIMHGVFGIQSSDSKFTAIGEEAFLPHSDTRSTGVFLLENFNVGPVRFELAARQNWQSIDTPLNPSAEHKPFSMSGSAIWTVFADYSVALSLSRSQRAPNAQELYADGIHIATNTYELGTATLSKETAKTIDLTFGKSEGDTNFMLGLYHSNYDNYIFAETLDQFEDFRLIRYVSADATFTGIDGEVSHRLTPELGIGLFGDYVRARLKNNGGDLPRIPAARLGIRADATFGNFSADAEFYRVFSQSRIAAYETETGGYNMLNATLAWKLPPHFADSEIFLRGTNLTNTFALNHASFIKNAAPLRGRNLVLGLRTSF